MMPYMFVYAILTALSRPGGRSFALLWFWKRCCSVMTGTALEVLDAGY